MSGRPKAICPGVPVLPSSAASDEAQRGAVAERRAERARQRGVVEVIVRRVVVGRDRGHVDRSSRRRPPFPPRPPPPRAVENDPPSKRSADLRLRRRPAAREQLDDAGHRVGSVERGIGAAHELDAIEVLRGDVAEIERAARLVQRNAVEQHLGVVALAAADEERRHRAETAGAHDRRPRRVAQEIGEQRLLLPLDLGARRTR